VLRQRRQREHQRSPARHGMPQSSQEGGGASVAGTGSVIAAPPS
jgi:hypothetical protein